jgi:hypothetical protein
MRRPLRVCDRRGTVKIRRIAQNLVLNVVKGGIIVSWGDSDAGDLGELRPDARDPWLRAARSWDRRSRAVQAFGFEWAHPPREPGEAPNVRYQTVIVADYRHAVPDPRDLPRFARLLMPRS